MQNKDVILLVVCMTSLALLLYKIKRVAETFSPMAEGGSLLSGRQEFIYIPPQSNVTSGGCYWDRSPPSKNCDSMHDLSSLGSLPPTVLQGGITVQTMGPLGPMHIGGDPNPYASMYFR